MLASTDEILTTHAGSLPRPAALLDLLVRVSKREAVDAAVARGHGRERAPARSSRSSSPPASTSATTASSRARASSPTCSTA